MGEYVCCMDFGTTRIKAAVFDEAGALVSLADTQAAEAAGEGGSVEFPADKYFDDALKLVRGAAEMAGIRPAGVCALCVTSQRASVVPLDKDGAAAGQALSWQDTRCGAVLENFRAAFGDTGRFEEITGLPFGALWSLAKILWLKSAAPGGNKIAGFALLHDYITRRLCGGDLLTDYSNASLTGLMDIAGLEWSGEILAAAGITKKELPRIVASASVAGKLTGEIASLTGLSAGTPVVVGGGDQQCAALGTGVAQPGQAGLCLGTAAVVSCPSARPVTDARGKFFCTAHAAPGRWVVEGIHNSFGGSIHWAADVLGLAAIQDVEKLASRVATSAGNPLFLPHLSGIGSPDFDAEARGAFLGLSLSHGPAHIARAVLDGVAMEMRRIIESIEPHTGALEIIISGGPAIQSAMIRPLVNFLNRTFYVSENQEATLLGAAILAWTGAGKFKDVFQGVSALAAGAAAPLPIDDRDVPAAVCEAVYSEYLFRIKSIKRKYVDRSP